AGQPGLPRICNAKIHMCRADRFYNPVYCVQTMVLPVPLPDMSATTLAAARNRPIDIAALVRVLCDLGRVERLADLGMVGPLVASAGSDSLFHCLFGRDSIRMAMD